MKTTMNALNDQVLEDVVGGNVTMFDAIDIALAAVGCPLGEAVYKRCNNECDFGFRVFVIEFSYLGIDHTIYVREIDGSYYEA